MADEGLTLSQVLRHAADLTDEIASGQLTDEGLRHRLDYLLNTLGVARATVEEMWKAARGDA